MTQGCAMRPFSSNEPNYSFHQGKVQPSGNKVVAVGCLELYGSNKHWKKKYGYHKRSLSETAMFRVKKLVGGTLRSRNYNAQGGETYAMIKALNKLIGLGMPETMMIASQSTMLGAFLS